MIPDASLYPSARAALTQSVPLGADQKAALASELARPAYRDAQGAPLPVADLVTRLNDSVTGPNPTPQGRVALPTLTQGQVIVITATLQAKKAAGLLASPPVTLPEGLDYVIDTLLPSVCKQDSLDMTTPNAQQVFAVISGSGLLSADEVSALATGPDPDWQAVVTTPAPARALGLGVVEASDIVSALAG